MESKKDDMELKDKIPKERRVKTKDTKGEYDEDGFFTTPNGSFWDMDGEYFNRYGFDIHGGKYVDKLDYIPGPNWIEELGCYPEDKDKYQKEEDINDEMEDDKDLEMLEGDEELIKEIDKINIKDDINDKNIDDDKYKKDNKKNEKKKNKKNKKKKDESFDEDEWEEIED